MLLADTSRHTLFAMCMLVYKHITPDLTLGCCLPDWSSASQQQSTALSGEHYITADVTFTLGKEPMRMRGGGAHSL